MYINDSQQKKVTFNCQLSAQNSGLAIWDYICVQLTLCAIGSLAHENLCAFSLLIVFRTM